MKLNLFIICILALVFCINVNASINHIINKGYNRMVERINAEKGPETINTLNIKNNNNNKDFSDLFGDSSSSSSDGHQHLPGYECIHDVIAKSIGIGSEKPEDVEASAKPLLKSAKGLTSVNANTTTYQPLRFYFDTRFLYNNTDISACSQAGQVVYLGGTSRADNPPPCDGTKSGCYYTCKDSDVLSNSVANLIQKDILITVQDILGEMLLVERTNGNLVLPSRHARGTFRTCDFNYNIPDYYFESGAPNADIIVFVTSRPVYSTSTIAYAAPCIYLLGDRPLAATINFNTRYFSPFVSNNKPSSFIFNEYVRVGIHEMTHGLGFTIDFFKYFRNKQTGSYYVPSPGSSVNTIGYTGSNIRYNYSRPAISTPSVKEFIQNHYQCFDESKAYQLLEDYGMKGTVGSHWEKRTVGEEYMLGYVSPVFPITELTLSLFEDMGWYEVDKTSAEPLMWGKGLGCNWFNNCDRKGWNYPGYFCENYNTMSCSPTRVGKGVCNVDPDDWENLPPYYQHFSNSKKVGDLIADGCPFYDVASQYCVDDNNNDIADSSIGEYYGQDSRCFEYSSAIDTDFRSLACWKFECRNDSNLFIKVNNEWVNCSVPGRKFLVSNVAFECPPYFYPCKNNIYHTLTNSSTLIYTGIPINSSPSNNNYSILSFLILLLVLIFNN